ncbi:MAG: DNA repair protein RecO [Bacteroidetes bacterium MedPE-SWsnd-G2]|nr:MAG: DNA repair protein RecO [Bacteroidetes bacterium MedPE-SWsnd-G2]
MLVKSNAIVLSKIKYGDSDIIVKCYTKHRGVGNYIVRGALKSKKGSGKIAYFQPLTQLVIEENFKPKHSLQSFKNVRIDYLYKTLHSDVYKSSIVMFLSEVLSASLFEEEENEPLYNYLESALQWLDLQSDYSNFHLLFLINLTRLLGFYPEVKHVDFPFFNLESGQFELKKTSNYSVSGEKLNVLKLFLGTNFDAITSIKLNGNQRQQILTMILQYFELHLDDFKKPKSLQIFNQVFS